MKLSYLKKTYYLAGPMTGIPQFNFPAFEAAAKELRDVGIKIISPVETDSETVRAAALASDDGRLDKGKIAGETWGQILGRDVEVIADQCEGIILLSGWEDSKGARLEVITGLLCRYPIFLYSGGKLEIYTRRGVLETVRNAMI